MSRLTWDRFRTGQALNGRLGAELEAQSGVGAALPAGALVGPWRIVELLGTGGMAHVYLAERADRQFGQQVALKLVRRNFALIDRLRHERRIVASLRHPHIVSLVDGGETADGDLWFAMALVDGVEIDQYVQQKQLDWKARLQLFDAVCGALEYAHGCGLIHRDIKPANILVDAHGLPRLLDFGIALDDGPGDGAQDHVLTPGFASPEQLAGETITTRSDLYQMGLVLQALLAPPGKLAMPRAARADAARLIARATAADPAARHASATALREDVTCLLERRPIASDRGSRSTRAARMLERHRIAFGVALAALLVLAVSLSVGALRLRDERNQALANEQRANSIADFLVGTLTQANPYAASKGAATILDAMDRAAQTLNDNLATSPDLRRELRQTIGTVYMDLDEARRCLELLGSDQASADLQAAAATDRARSMILRAGCHTALDERAEATRWLDSASSVLEGDGSVRADQLRAFILVEQGELLALDARWDESNRMLERGLALAERSGSLEQQYRANRFLGNNFQAANDNERAVVMLEKALQLASSALGPTHRNTLTTAGGLGMVQAKLGRWKEAEATILAALRASETIRHRDAGAEMVVAQLRENYSAILWNQNRLAECIDQALLSLEIYQRMTAANSSQGFNPAWRVATCAYQSKDLDRAFDYAQKSLAYARNGVPMGGINSLRMLAAVSARRNDLAEARRYLDEADAAVARTQVTNPNILTALHLTRALLAARSGEVESARAQLETADASVAPAGKYAAWLRQERDEIEAMIPAALTVP
ncbi:MAG: serine/threonine protein kinase [Rhodanobacteraceae bacterium]|nr:serine/threonine protein kinase [Rhodanobacteraceae bacterium]